MALKTSPKSSTWRNTSVYQRFLMLVIRQTHGHRLHCKVSRGDFFCFFIHIPKGGEVAWVDELQLLRKLLCLLSLRNEGEKLQKCYKHLLSKLKNKNYSQIWDKLDDNTNYIFALTCRSKNKQKESSRDCEVPFKVPNDLWTCFFFNQVIYGLSIQICNFVFISLPFYNPWSFVWSRQTWNIQNDSCSCHLQTFEILPKSVGIESRKVHAPKNRGKNLTFTSMLFVVGVQDWNPNPFWRINWFISEWRTETLRVDEIRTYVLFYALKTWNWSLVNISKRKQCFMAVIRWNKFPNGFHKSFPTMYVSRQSNFCWTNFHPNWHENDRRRKTLSFFLKLTPNFYLFRWVKLFR